MPMYEYRCDTCRATHLITDDPDGQRKARADLGHVPCTCGGVYRRRFSFHAAPVMHAHLNHATGTVISSPRQFRSELRRISDESEARTGIPTNLQPADPHELMADALDTHGDDGLKSQHDAAVKRGEKEPTGRMVF